MGQHVLVPVDGSEQSKKAFRYVLDELPESTITLLHVINPASMVAYSDEDYFDMDGYQAEVKRRRNQSEQLLSTLADTAADQGIEVETIITTGRPARQILEVASDQGVDHIVMGSRGRSGVGRVLFGSVAETVTRRATVPVTIVR